MSTKSSFEFVFSCYELSVSLLFCSLKSCSKSSFLVYETYIIPFYILISERKLNLKQIEKKVQREYFEI